MDLLKGITGPDRILAVMKAKRVKNVHIAKKEKVTPQYVSYVINGKSVGHRIRRAIAKACGVPVTELWPDEEPTDPEIQAAA